MHYAIVVTVGAREAIREMEDEEKDVLIPSLKTELLESDGTPHSDADIVTHYRSDYHGCRLSSGHVVVYRMMTEPELKALSRELRQELLSHGVIVFDILSGGSSFPGGVVLPR